MNFKQIKKSLIEKFDVWLAKIAPRILKDFQSGMLDITNWEVTNNSDVLPVLVDYPGSILFYAEKEQYGIYMHGIPPKQFVFIFDKMLYRAGASILTGPKRPLTTYGYTDMDFKDRPTVVLKGWKMQVLMRVLTRQILAGGRTRTRIKNLTQTEIDQIRDRNKDVKQEKKQPLMVGFQNDNDTILNKIYPTNATNKEG